MSIRSASLTLLLLLCMRVAFCQTPDSAPRSVPPLTVPQHMLRAQEDMRRQRPDLAIPEYQAVLATDPSNRDAQANLGVLLYFAKQYPQAIPHLRAAVDAQPDLWKLRALLGLAETHVPNNPTAQSDLEAALPHLKGEKVQAEVGHLLIDRYTAQGDLDHAAAAVALLLQSDPANPTLLLLDYRLLSDLAGRALLDLALAAPHSAEIHAAMARELSRQGNEAAAITNYRAALAIQPLLPGLAFEFGNVLHSSTNQQLRDEAETQFKAAIAANPRDEKAYLMLGEIAAARGDNAAALDNDTHAVDLQPDDPDACIELAKLLTSTGQLDRARTLLTHAIQLDPTNATAYYRLSTIDRQQKHPEAAKQDLAEYQKYKEIKDKLRDVFQTMRVPLDRSEPDNGMSR